VQTEAVCNEGCDDDTPCVDGSQCIDGTCRNPECPGESSCECPEEPTPTPTPQRVVEVTPEPILPESGSSNAFVAISLLLIVFGLPLALAGLFLSWKEQGEDA
jgi:hypothetical protein